MQRLSARPIKTFSIGFEDRAFDESRYAAKVAKHLGTEHHELVVSMNEPLDIIPRIPEMYDEPFGDSSQIPTFLVSKLAARHVKVALSGDGGDELFCGYGRYARTQEVWTGLSLLPHSARSVASKFVSGCAKVLNSRVTDVLSRVFPPSELTQNLPDKCRSLAHYMNARSFDDLYDRAVSNWQTADFDEWGTGTVFSGLPNLSHPLRSNLERMMFTDLVTYLPDDILVKVDRASMAVGLEARVPLLDHRLVDFSWSIPIEEKRRGKVGKAILKDVLARYIPRELVDRPKMGFGIPIDTWLRGPLKEWGIDLIGRSDLSQFGFHSATELNREWQRVQHDEQAGGSRLWVVLMLLAWLERWR
jgi:asparagine synthase (glutamine-hydrolysing)